MKSYRKWMKIFISVFISVCLLIISLNYFVDPFGVFGDKYFKMYGYNMKQNIRMAKIGYLDSHFTQFDSYIIGGSKSGSLLPKSAEKYFKGSKFYNLTMTGGRFYDYQKTLEYIIKNYKVKNIILQISQLEIDKPGTSKGFSGMLNGKVESDFPALFFLQTLFQHPQYSIEKIKEAQKWTREYEAQFFYNYKNGSYNREKQDIEIENDSKKYYSNKALFPDKEKPKLGKAIQENLNIMKKIVKLCEENDINLLTISAPTYKVEMDSYPKALWVDYMTEIGKITDYWNFSGYNSINNSNTNFYDNEHFRVKVGDMILAKIFGDKSIEVPLDFGNKISKE
jgi:hypothetical protein